MHDPRHIGEVFGKLRHVAAVDDNQIRSPLGEFPLNCVMQLYLIQSKYRKRRPPEEGFERAQFYCQLADRRGTDGVYIRLQARDVGKVTGTIAEAEDMHYVPRGKVADLVERGYFVATVGWKRDPSAHVKNSHKWAVVVEEIRGRPAGRPWQPRRSANRWHGSSKCRSYH